MFWMITFMFLLLFWRFSTVAIKLSLFCWPWFLAYSLFFPSTFPFIHVCVSLALIDTHCHSVVDASLACSLHKPYKPHSMLKWVFLNYPDVLLFPVKIWCHKDVYRLLFNEKQYLLSTSRRTGTQQQWYERSKMAAVSLCIGCWEKLQRALMLVITEANLRCHQKASSRPALCLCSLMLITVANTLGTLIYWLKDEASL